LHQRRRTTGAVSSTLQEPLVSFSSRRHLRLSSGAYRCTHRQMVVWSTDRPRSVTSSSTSRYERQYRKYHRTAHTMITGSKCRHLNRAGRGLHTAPAYQNVLGSRFATHPLRAFDRLCAACGGEGLATAEEPLQIARRDTFL